MHPMTDVPTTALAIRETIPPVERNQIHLSPTSPPERVRETISQLAKDSVAVSYVDKSLKFLMGKACLMVKQRKLYRTFGFRSNEAWLKAEVYRPGLSHGTVWKGIRAVKAFPTTPAEQLAGIPEQSLTTAAQIVLKEHLTGKAAAKILGEAQKLPADEFADAHGREALRTGFAVIRIVTSKSFQKEFYQKAGEDPEGFLKDLIRTNRKEARRSEAA